MKTLIFSKVLFDLFARIECTQDKQNALNPTHAHTHTHTTWEVNFRTIITQYVDIILCAPNVLRIKFLVCYFARCVFRSYWYRPWQWECGMTMTARQRQRRMPYWWQHWHHCTKRSLAVRRKACNIVNTFETSLPHFIDCCLSKHDRFFSLRFFFFCSFRFNSGIAVCIKDTQNRTEIRVNCILFRTRTQWAIDEARTRYLRHFTIFIRTIVVHKFCANRIFSLPEREDGASFFVVVVAVYFVTHAAAIDDADSREKISANFCYLLRYIYFFFLVFSSSKWKVKFFGCWCCCCISIHLKRSTFFKFIASVLDENVAIAKIFL